MSKVEGNRTRHKKILLLLTTYHDRFRKERGFLGCITISKTYRENIIISPSRNITSRLLYVYYIGCPTKRLFDLKENLKR